MLCENCGVRVSETDTHCPNCGMEITRNSSEKIQTNGFESIFGTNGKSNTKKQIFSICGAILVFAVVVSVVLSIVLQNRNSSNVVSTTSYYSETNNSQDNNYEDGTEHIFSEESIDNRYGIRDDIELPDSYCDVITYLVSGLDEEDSLPVRKGPDTSYEKLTILEQGEQVDVVGKSDINDDWVLIYREVYDEYGWVNMNYLIVALQYSNEFYDELQYIVNVSEDDVLPIRRGPDTSYKKVTDIDKGEVVVAKGSSDDNRWWFVYYEAASVYGWVNKDYLIEAIKAKEITFGTYPQTRVSDNALISKLNELAPKWDEWISYNYFSGAGNNWSDGSGEESDYMRYCDIEFNGDLYRGVRFTSYRKVYTNYKSDESTEYSPQSENGYNINNTYWFKWEPLIWEVLDYDTGLILCKNIIDTVPFNNTLFGPGGSKGFFMDSECTIYANNYKESSLRLWLTTETDDNSFYNTAFTQSEKNMIVFTELSNSAYSSRYDSDSTTDKVFVLSIDDIRNDLYWNEDGATKVAYGTDYAKCQGLNTPTVDGASLWKTRSGGTYPSLICYVNESGDYDTGCDTFNTSVGVRPALCLSSLNYQ